ncbi:MAG: DUF1073 domain-containing protein [Rhizobium leguminosarum]|nr:DUF1073 domain-containing protein [Rhizobium leguminosarum]
MSNVIAFVRDSLTSLVSRMGTDRDKAATTFYAHTVMSDEQLIAAYSTAWLPRKIDPMQPLEVDRIGKGGIRYLNVMTRRQLSAGEIDRNPESEWYGQPSYYKLSGANGLQVDIHPSRLVRFTGAMPADDEITGNPWQGWGDSVLQATLDAIKNADSTAGNIASLVFEAKIDIIRVPDFMANLGNEVYRSKILERYTLANMSKGINGTLLLDKEEEYETKTAQLSGLTDILMAFMQIVSGAADIPVTRLLGQSPAGMNSTGTSDMKNYHDRIQSMQELEFSPAMRRLDECIERSADVKDPDVHYRWAPLEQMSEKERADIFKTTADAARQLVGTGTGQEIITREAISKALTNRLVEDGVLPGLDAAIEEYGTIEEQEPSEEELAAAAAAANQNQPPANQRRAANDAAPRTLYVRRDVINRAEITAWAKEQGFTDIVPDLHVTITYSKQPVDWFEMGESWSPRLEISAGGPRQMQALGQSGEYYALLITANELKWRHEAMIELGASWEWPEYQPHISIQIGGDIDLSKVTPYQGKIVLGPEIFEEVRED